MLSIHWENVTNHLTPDCEWNLLVVLESFLGLNAIVSRSR